jgi:hypothetical protein
MKIFMDIIGFYISFLLRLKKALAFSEAKAFFSSKKTSAKYGLSSVKVRR